MKGMETKLKINITKKETIILIAIILIQSIIYVITGINKQYIHMDEAYSLGLANYDKVEIQANEDFYDNWHSGEYYEDYLTVNEGDKFLEPVYENQKNDVHPPLYYLLLRTAMQFNIGRYSKWSGIILNMIIYVAITIFIYLIAKEILKDTKKSAIVAFLSALSLASLDCVIYIRMYALATLNILVATYLHLKLFKKEEKYLYVLIGISALIGSLTHYYYLFYLAMLFIILVIKFIKEKKYKQLRNYIITMCIAAGLSLAIFPYSINHMFFGYRGQGAISNLLNIRKFTESIASYIKKVNIYVFNNVLYLLIVIMLITIIYKKIRREKIFEEKNKLMKLIILPTIFYFILVAVSSPWIELRYIMPICPMIFLIVMYYLYRIIESINKPKISKIIISIISIIFLLAPFIYKLEPEVMYSDKKEIVDTVKEKCNVPALYIFNTQNNRFLDDIYLFSILDESYIAKDIDCTEESIKSILNNKDVSKGIILFINEGNDNDKIINTIIKAENLNKCTYLKRLNAADAYYIE